jgi:hypothetical protein
MYRTAKTIGMAISLTFAGMGSSLCQNMDCPALAKIVMHPALAPLSIFKDVNANFLYYCKGIGDPVPRLQQFQKAGAPDCRALQAQVESDFKSGISLSFADNKIAETAWYFCDGAAAQDDQQRQQQKLFELQQQATAERGKALITSLFGMAAGTVTGVLANRHSVPVGLPGSPSSPAMRPVPGCVQPPPAHAGSVADIQAYMECAREQTQGMPPPAAARPQDVYASCLSLAHAGYSAAFMPTYCRQFGFK